MYQTYYQLYTVFDGEPENKEMFEQFYTIPYRPPPLTSSPPPQKKNDDEMAEFSLSGANNGLPEVRHIGGLLEVRW